jgi:hypothetical protein
LTEPDSGRGEIYHRHPQILPNGRFILLDVFKADGAHPSLISLDTGTWADLGLGVTNGAVYSAGHPVYHQ